MATRSGVRAPHRSGGPARSPYAHGNKMLTADYRMVPVVVERSVPATRSRPTKLPPNPPMDLYEIEINKRYRQRVAKRLARSAGWTEAPPQPKTRMGIAIDAGRRMAQAHEDHAIGVARRLHLR